jgi:hypothetical protein
MSLRPSLDRQATSAFMSTTEINGNGLSLPSSDRNALPHSPSPTPPALQGCQKAKFAVAGDQLKDGCTHQKLSIDG